MRLLNSDGSFNMKTILSPIVSKIQIILLTFLVASFSAVLASAQNQPSASKPDNEAPQFLTNAPPPGFATRVDYLKSFNSEKDIRDARRAGLINEDESMLAMGALVDREQNKASMDTYGKVVDQNAQPVAGIKVSGRLEIGIGDYKDYHAETDSQGLFQFLGLHGSGLIMHFQKQGYYFDENLLPERPKNYLPDPKNPIMLQMWKLHGAEPMNHSYIQSSVPCDGNPEHFNLLVDKMNNEVPDVHPSVGDFTVKLTREPLIVDRRKPFNWSATLSITNGGLVEFTNQPYPYEAPETGYQSVVTIDFPTNAPQWQYEINKNYFFKSGDGRVYGRMTVHLRADRPQPPTYFDADIYANPNGSRNLEFDGNKQINR
jgi:hypothetical protein